jgi:hypothetical protein
MIYCPVCHGQDCECQSGCPVCLGYGEDIYGMKTCPNCDPPDDILERPECVECFGPLDDWALENDLEYCGPCRCKIIEDADSADYQEYLMDMSKDYWNMLNEPVEKFIRRTRLAWRQTKKGGFRAQLNDYNIVVFRNENYPGWSIGRYLSNGNKEFQNPEFENPRQAVLRIEDGHPGGIQRPLINGGATTVFEL